MDVDGLRRCGTTRKRAKTLRWPLLLGSSRRNGSTRCYRKREQAALFCEYVAQLLDEGCLISDAIEAFYPHVLALPVGNVSSAMSSAFSRNARWKSLMLWLS